MNPIELFLFLLDRGFVYDKDNTKELRFTNDADFLQTLHEQGIINVIEHGKIVVESQNLPFAYFEDKIEFIEQSNLLSFNKPVIIKNYSVNQSSYFSDIDYSAFENDQICKPAATDFFFTNAKTFLQSKDFFKNQTVQSNNSFEFVDYFSFSNRSITFSSFFDKKKVKFNFPLAGVIELDPEINYSHLFQEFLDLFEENKQYPVFLKKSLIKFLYNSENSYKSLFLNLTKICDEAKIDFNVFIHELSIDKFKEEYKEYKQKYFSSQNEILTKITTQILALPISITGIVFGIDKLHDNFLALFIVCFGLLSYIVYITFLIKIYSTDVSNLFNQTNHDFKSLEEQVFFKSQPDELEYFENIKISLISRLNNLYYLIKMFVVIIWISISFISLYTISKFVQFQNLSHVLIVSILFASILGLIHSHILFKKEN